MQNKQDIQKEFSTCLEDSAFAETLQKTMDQQGAGSLNSMFPNAENDLLTEKNSKTHGQVMVETIMNLHRCADCPIRRQANAKPHSLLARIHGWHKTWWPGWKIYQTELRACNGKATANKRIIIEENK